MTDRQKRHFIIGFFHNTRIRLFHRWCYLEDEAIDQAKQGYQEAYGTWPGDPASIQIEG